LVKASGDTTQDLSDVLEETVRDLLAQTNAPDTRKSGRE
jgi:hypothetical protein